MSEYDDLKVEYMQGWNTWNVFSVLSHVHLPEGFAINIGLYEQANGKFLRSALPSRHGENDETVRLGERTYDGTYTELELSFRDVTIGIQSTVVDNQVVILVTPLKMQPVPAVLVVSCGFLWNRPGNVYKKEHTLHAANNSQNYIIHITGQPAEDPVLDLACPFASISLCDQIVISTGRVFTIQETQDLIGLAKAQLCPGRRDEKEEARVAIMSAVAWNTLYDPRKDRVLTPVSRLWSAGTGGYVLYCWDNCFAALLAMLDNQYLAYANLIEITSEATRDGFIPNMSTGMGLKSLDRSQPPVGSFCLLEVYRRFGETWLLRQLFSRLLKWNDWFYDHRRTSRGLMCWGSDPYQPIYGNFWETAGVGDSFGAALESGLDNSPMYDEVPFDSETHLHLQADAGLMGLYILDCSCLAEIAAILGDKETRDRLLKRRQETEQALDLLWDDAFGLHCNLRLDTNQFSHRISPANFYTLFSQKISGQQLERIKTHFFDLNEFYGEFMLPSIARNDPAYPEQDYWRGRIWAPMNLLTFLAFRQQKCDDVCEIIREKSMRLFLREWQEHGHIHENYNAETGWGCDVKNSDQFYHWGGLLGLISFLS